VFEGAQPLWFLDKNLIKLVLEIFNLGRNDRLFMNNNGPL
jgi:hypothetical protein